MAGPNRDPLFSGAPDVQVGGAVLGPTAQTGQDGSASSGIYQIFQADATNGGFLQKIVLKANGSPAQTGVRFYVCTNPTGAFTAGTTNTTANTSLYCDATLGAQTLNQTTGSQSIEIPFNIALPPGYRILVSFGTSTGAAGTGYVTTAIAGKF